MAFDPIVPYSEIFWPENVNLESYKADEHKNPGSNKSYHFLMSFTKQDVNLFYQTAILQWP